MGPSASLGPKGAPADGASDSAARPSSSSARRSEAQGAGASHRASAPRRYYCSSCSFSSPVAGTVSTHCWSGSKGFKLPGGTAAHPRFVGYSPLTHQVSTRELSSALACVALPICHHNDCSRASKCPGTYTICWLPLVVRRSVCTNGPTQASSPTSVPSVTSGVPRTATCSATSEGTQGRGRFCVPSALSQLSAPPASSTT